MYRLLLLLLLILGLGAPTAQAWTVRANQVHYGDIQLSEPTLTRIGAQVNLSAKLLQVAALELNQAQVTLDCTLTIDANDAMACAGNAAAKSPNWRGGVELRADGGDLDATLNVADAKINWTSRLQDDGNTNYLLRAQRLPVTWFKSRLMNLWPELASLSGRLDTDLSWTDHSNAMKGSLALNALSFDSADGELAGADLLISGPMTLQLGAHSIWQWQPRSLRGQLLLGSMYFELPQTTNALQLKAATDAAGQWQLPLLGWNDAAGLMLRAAVFITAEGELDIRLHELGADLETVVPRYLASTLSTVGFDGLDVRGRLTGSGHFQAGAWKDFDWDLQQVSIQDPARRIRVERLQGGLRMGEIAAENEIDWSGVRVFDLALGDGHAEWLWSPQSWQLKQPIQVALLGGSVRLNALSRTRLQDRAQWLGSLALERIDLLNLTRALDWPDIDGTLSSKTSDFEFRDGGLQSDAVFEFDAFAGKIRVSEVSSERTFGIAPSLAGVVEFDNLDLEKLTSTFDFGSMQGWLDGRIDALRLLDWTPVAFDAKLHTDDKFPGKQRISQRAVDGLSSVAGGGSGGGALSRLVDTFSYAKIGLSCRLADDVCHMAGLEPEGNGYVILRGAGLPRLTVVGHQKRVDWPILLTRLSAASSGQMPTIK